MLSIRVAVLDASVVATMLGTELGISRRVFNLKTLTKRLDTHLAGVI